MKPIYDSWLIQIEITNVCTQKCANCTRCVGHYERPYFMDLATVEKAIDSLEGYLGGTFGGGKVGIMGGEPTLHPQFREICELLQRKVPAHKCGLWTSGFKWDEYKSLIKKTFRDGVLFNDHMGPVQHHQPVLVAIDEVVPDKKLMWELIDKCWIQQQWSASINHKGCFFCEVAAAFDVLFDGPGGYPIEKGWWNKTPEQFRDQVERYCVRCSGCLPLPARPSTDAQDLMSRGNYNKLVAINSPKVRKGGYEIFEGTLDAQKIAEYQQKWRPWQYLGESFQFNFQRKKHLKPDELWLIKPFDNIRRYFYRTLALFGFK